MTVALILGAGGFLGRHIVSGLAAAGDRTALRIVEADLPGRGEGPNFVPLDLRADPGVIGRQIRATAAAVIVNCTGRTAGTPDELRAANVDAVARLLEGIKASGLRPRLIQIGSAAEYGVAPEGVPVAESFPPAPVGAYGAAKLAGTRLVLAARAQRGLDAVVLRVFNAVGPGMPANTLPGAALERLTQAVADGSTRVEMGPLGSVRDFVDVRDIASAVEAAIGASAIHEPVLNVGTGRGSTARDLVAALARRVGFDGVIGEAAMPSARSGDVPWMVADVSLMSRTLGWTADKDLESIAGALVTPGSAAVS